MPRQQQEDRKQSDRRWKDKNPRNVSGLEAHDSELASARKNPKEDHAGKPLSRIQTWKYNIIMYLTCSLLQVVFYLGKVCPRSSLYKDLATQCIKDGIPRERADYYTCLLPLHYILNLLRD